MEEKIILISKYIMTVLNKISNFNEFKNYKPELIKAIKNIVICTNNILNNNDISSKINENTIHNSNPINKTSLSDELNLQYNYDSFLNKDYSNYFPKYIISNLNSENDLPINLKNSINSVNSIKSNKTNNFIEDKNNIINKKKQEIITNILIKINNNETIYPILSKLFGKNIKEELLSGNVQDDVINRIKYVVNQIEKIKIQSIKNEINNNTKEKIEYNTIQYEDNKKEKIFKKPLRYQSLNNLKKNLSSNNISKSSIKQKKAKSYRIKKPFIHSTCPYGRYFDEPLQKGGESKLPGTNRIFNYLYNEGYY